MGRNHILGKIGWLDDMRDLVENGTLYLQRLGIYRDLECTVRGDPNEGLLLHYGAENATLKVTAKIGGEEVPLPGVSINLSCSAVKHGAYCMLGVGIPDNVDDGINLGAAAIAAAKDQRLDKFGDTLVVFLDTKEFIRRFERAAREAGHEVEHGPIEYVPSSHCGDMGPFRKFDDLAYQAEYRFLTDQPIDKSPLILKAGCLLDIANWIPLKKLRDAS